MSDPAGGRVDALAIDLAERGLIPDRVIRAHVRRRLAAQLDGALADGAFAAPARAAFRARLADAPFAPTGAAPDEPDLPAAFFAPWLGPRLKYSAALWSRGARDLAEAEEAMLELTCERARIEDGQSILDLGCGWGALALWIAGRYPRARVTAVTRSSAQATYIADQARARGLVAPRVLVADFRALELAERFDRVIAIESFEHVRNWPALLRRVHGWLAPGGILFVQAIACRDYAYTYDPGDRGGWMARHFLSGALMPDDSLLAAFDEHVVEETRWIVAGSDYAKTVETWLARLDAARGPTRAALVEALGRAHADRMLRRWRLMLLFCAELFAFGEDRRWRIVHSTSRPRPGA